MVLLILKMPAAVEGSHPGKILVSVISFSARNPQRLTLQLENTLAYTMTIPRQNLTECC
jgi:hypothetical protein